MGSPGLARNGRRPGMGESLSTAKVNLKGYTSILYAMIMLGANVEFCGRVYFSQRGIYMFVCWIN